ncbi:polyketide cyclase/dehydrase/lipid transport protein [Actinocorallia herbida]|uniref:Polyketide cyclase/dehydrase/lipid transport protein n=1 Tax=Actinocorallia herbida TaxID=58109 RepID=A0A3N1CRR4_9ACTN|nr:SRPBCC family protein [Actinocorallia herbida]ROO83844.1 polyketide cyclase/dehydrase/lipid transport protein [Actinocorallia herbida]
MADRTSSSITINAAKSKIMGVIADYAAYPQWADGISAAEVVSSDAQGRPEVVRMTLASGPIKDTYSVRCHWSGEDELRWDLAEPGTVVSGLSGRYALGEGVNGTEVRYELAVDVKIPMIGMIRRKAEKVIIDSALKGLKRRVEVAAAG